MRQMKDSGIEWIGEMPETWSIRRIKNVASICNGKEIETEGGDVPVYGSGGIFKYTNKSLYVGESLLMGRKGTIDNPIIVDGAFWTVDTMFYMSNIKDIVLKYLYYFCSAVVDYNYFKSGCVLPSMTQSEIGNIFFPYPQILTQQKIADFLDGKCAKIDSLIAHEEATIEELKAYKQSVITEAVTKGLDKSVPMKDSGVEWIGEIPESWSVIATKRLFSIISGATPKSDNSEFWDGDIKWITPADYKTDDVYVSMGRRNITEKGLKSCNTTLIPNGSIIFSKRAPIGAVAINTNELCTNQGCIACIANTNLVMKFYYYVMSVCTEYYDLLGTGTTFKEISLQEFSEFILPDLPQQEQKQIAEYLDKKCACIDSLVSSKQNKIEELKEYKKSLIYEYVTGKKEVA